MSPLSKRCSCPQLPLYTPDLSQVSHNARPLDTEEQMSIMAQGADGKRMTYEALIGPPEIRQSRML